MSTRKGQAASVTLLRREQLRSASAPTYSIVGFPTSIRRKSRARLWSMEGPGNHSKGSPVVSFLFLLEPKGDPAQRSAFGKEEGGCEYGAFAAPAEAEWSRLLLTLRRFFSFSEKRKKRMGAQKRGGGNARPYGIYFGAVENREPTIPPSRLRRATSLYTMEASAAVG